MNASITSRELVGWRAGRPEEDPEKMKRWGFVTAKPSEHLIHVRGGKVTDKSGQGATCFKWPWDSVAIVPTSLQQLSFRADQVSAEKVGVEVVGLAVYRIAEPELAFRVLNFSYPERAQQKLEETLTSMFVGATRRIVATLGVEDCMRKRKAALAEELLREIAPVVGGEGRPDDFTTRGWGVVIDTIEIQARAIAVGVRRHASALSRGAGTTCACRRGARRASDRRG
jgi:regulator of protease activity HflC (stomatin/prohibitin superfamily)